MYMFQILIKRKHAYKNRKLVLNYVNQNNVFKPLNIVCLHFNVYYTFDHYLSNHNTKYTHVHVKRT